MGTYLLQLISEQGTHVQNSCNFFLEVCQQHQHTSETCEMLNLLAKKWHKIQVVTLHFSIKPLHLLFYVS